MSPRARPSCTAAEHETHVALRSLTSGCSIMWNHSATLIPLLTPLIDICALPSHTWTYVHVRAARLSPTRLPSVLENLGEWPAAGGVDALLRPQG